MSSGQIVVLVLVVVAFAFIATRPEFRRRLAETPPIRRVSLLGLAVLAVAIVIWIAGTTGIRL
jgi:hypothetical protein